MVQYREIYPGYIGFDCPALRATLSAANCADNWKHRRCLACNGCPIGAEHAGENPAPPVRARLPCVRCGRSDLRLLSRCLCISCYNREREAVKGRNAKGIRAEIDTKRQEHAAALEAWGSARAAYRAALLTTGGCYAQRQAAVSTERDVNVIATAITAMETELAEVSRLDAEHRAKQLMEAGAAALNAALKPYDLEYFA